MNGQVKKIFEFLKNGFHEIRSSLDLSFEDDSVADEKIPFLAYLASVLKEHSFFPYEPPAGSKRFRNLIADFMKTYHHVPFCADVRKLSLQVNCRYMLYVIVFCLHTCLYTLDRSSSFTVLDAIKPTSRLFMIAFF